VGVGLLVTACGPSVPARGTSQPVSPTALPKLTLDAPLDPPVTVRVGQTLALSEAGQFIGIERGYFREQGLNIEFSKFDSAGGMTAPLATNQLDVGSGATGAGLFNAMARGVAIKIAGPQARHDPGASAVSIMVRRDLIDNGDFKSYSDLRGRRIAVNARGVATEFAASLALQQGGLRLDDAELVELGFPEMFAAFTNRAIDVAFQAEPAATQAAAAGVAVKWREVADVKPGIQFTVVLYSPQFAASEAARRWMLAYLQGVRDYNDAFKRNRGREEVTAILTRQTPVKDPQLYKQMGFAYIDPNGYVDEGSLNEQLQWYRGRGLVTGEVNLKQAIDTSFASYAVQHLGPYRSDPV
jgi:NitT/TauT family transport system substrate-binding protein